MTSRRVRILIDGGQADVEFPIQGDIGHEFDSETKTALFTVSTSSEDLLRALAPEAGAEAAGEPAEAQGDALGDESNPPEHLIGDPGAHQQRPEDIPDDFARGLYPRPLIMLKVRRDGSDDTITVECMDAEIRRDEDREELRVQWGVGEVPRTRATLDVTVPPAVFDSMRQQPPGAEHPLISWWVAYARDAAERTVPKAVEYGSVELVEAGRTLARLMGRGEVSDQEAMEVQIYQYVMGKMGRWTAAMSRDERVSDDTIFDILVYATMVAKIRETGEWT